MAFLHENREEFRNAVNLASERFHILPVVSEKDYYVTIDGHTFLEDDKWPVYTYHITKEILGIE